MDGFDHFGQRAQKLLETVEKVIVGKRRVVELALCGLFANGHVLIEDIPGVGKTTLAKAIAKAIGGTFRRIQFTPDLLPADITGTSIFNQKTGDFEFRAGPVFANIVLADEINRATPKTQASLLEAMEERQVTVDGQTRRLPPPFLVIATDNPIEYQGTYPLPEAQLDRFLLRISMGYPSRDEEVRVIEDQMLLHPIENVEPAVGVNEIVEMQRQVREVKVAECLKGYVVDIVGATRRHGGFALGASPRGSLGLTRCAQALAALRGRLYVLPDDIKECVLPVLSHRVCLRLGGERPTEETQQLLGEVLNTVPVPTTQDL